MFLDICLFYSLKSLSPLDHWNVKGNAFKNRDWCCCDWRFWRLEWNLNCWFTYFCSFNNRQPNIRIRLFTIINWTLDFYFYSLKCNGIGIAGHGSSFSFQASLDLKEKSVVNFSKLGSLSNREKIILK